MSTQFSVSALTAPRLLNNEQQEQKDELMDAGNAAFDAEAYPTAFEHYHQASLVDPSDAEVWNALGLTYANLDYIREAWRSYRLALLADPENLNALWYSAEFLYNQEDFELCQLLLKRYLLFEDDAEQQAAGEELLQEVTHLLGEEEEEGDTLLTDVAEEDEGDGTELPAGFDTDTLEPAADADEDEDDFADEDETDEELYTGKFVAGVGLSLGDLGQRCRQCSTALPTDAPYCYACHAPCFYEAEVIEA